MKWGRLFKARNDEIGLGVCVSYPKSGRTWLRVMLDELGIPLRYAHGGSAFHQDRFRSPSDFLGKSKVLFLHRGPIDTTVSGFFQVTKREAWRGLFTGSMSEFIRSPLGITRTLRFNSTWLDALPGEEALATTYEALHMDTDAELRRIAEWLGVSASAERIAEASQAGQFETMKAKETAGSYSDKYDHRLEPSDVTDPNSFKVRRGVVGGYRKYLSDADIEFCFQLMRKDAAGRM
jgi:hypothetical protein